MPDTFIKIASVTVGSTPVTTIDFTSIPSTYTDLLVKISVRSNNGGNDDSVVFGLNGNAFNSSMTNRVLRGTGSSAVSASGSYSIAGYTSGGGSTASTFGNIEIYIPNYAGSSNKSISGDGVSENNGTAAVAQLSANLWSNTAAITSISLSTGGGGNFVQYSTATLYGIKNS